MVQVKLSSIQQEKKKKVTLSSSTLHVPLSLSLSLSILLINSNTAPDISFLYRKSKFMGIDAIYFFS